MLSASGQSPLRFTLSVASVRAARSGGQDVRAPGCNVSKTLSRYAADPK